MSKRYSRMLAICLLSALTLPAVAIAADWVHTEAFNAANTKFDSKDYAGALSDLNRSISQDAGDSLAWAMRAACKSKVGDWDGALKDAEQAISIAERNNDPNLPGYRTIRSNLIEARPQPGSASLAPTPAPASSSGPIDPAQIVATHNRWRAEVGVGPISYSNEVATSAQAWADHLKETRNCGMMHSSGANGENLYWAGAWSNGPAQDIKSDAPVNAWASEKKDYNYDSNQCAPGAVCGHYTQVVWADSTTVGCGMALCPNNNQVWVCQYSPAGNWVGRKPY